MLQLEKSQVQKLQLPTRSVSIHFISKLKLVKEFRDLNLKENVDLEMRLMPNYNRIRDHPFKTSANFHNFGSLPLSRRQFFLLLSDSKFGKFLTLSPKNFPAFRVERLESLYFPP